MVVKTDPNSLYRQVFNRDLNFFLYVIDHTSPPYNLKLHISTKSNSEMYSDSELKFHLATFINFNTDL